MCFYSRMLCKSGRISLELRANSPPTVRRVPQFLMRRARGARAHRRREVRAVGDSEALSDDAERRQQPVPRDGGHCLECTHSRYFSTSLRDIRKRVKGTTWKKFGSREPVLVPRISRWIYARVRSVRGSGHSRETLNRRWIARGTFVNATGVPHDA